MILRKDQGRSRQTVVEISSFRPGTLLKLVLLIPRPYIACSTPHSQCRECFDHKKQRKIIKNLDFGVNLSGLGTRI